MNPINACCAECGADGGVSLKTCKSCMLVRYCNAGCQRNHWATHKKECKQRVAELRDEALFKDPPAMEDCPICFLPMPKKLICCISLPPATISSVPINDFAEANEELATNGTDYYYSCCGKNICTGCIYSFCESGNMGKCPFCNCDRTNTTVEERVEEIMKRVEANDPASICNLGSYYYHGLRGLQQNKVKALELLTRAAELGDSEAHNQLGFLFGEGGDLKKTKFHYEAGAMAGHELARNTLGRIEFKSGNIERAVKHWTIAAAAGEYQSMHKLITLFEKGSSFVSRESIDTTLTAYNKSCAEMRSKARDTAISMLMVNN